MIWLSIRVCAVVVAVILRGSPLAVRATALPDTERQQAVFAAGVAKVDITPPPGLSTGGYGPAGAIARGHLTRLYARAIFLRHADGNPLLLISVESFAVPQIFREAVVKKFRQLRIPVREESVIVAATHTHHGPGNYLSSEAYNHLGSRFAGYRPALRNHLVDGIVRAAVKAESASRDPGAVEIHLRQGALPYTALRNRSPRTFMLNRDAAAIIERLNPVGPKTPAECSQQRAHDEPEEDWDIAGCPRLRAVNRSVRVLDIRKNARPIGSVVFAAFHPTVLQPDTPLYSSDFAGVAMRRIESVNGDGFVAAFFNGAEGDISARRTGRDLHDLWKHADLFVKAINEASGSRLDLTPSIVTRSYWATPGDPVGEPPVRLPKQARGGAALLGGAEGDRTPLYALGWRERVTAARADKEHGAKLNPLDSNLLPVPDMTDLLLARSDQFPRSLPLSYARLGPLEIFAAPTEMSTATGERIAALGGNHDLTVVAGLANEYASYTATDDEHARQDYMGASTLWGPAEAPFFREVLRLLQAGSLKPAKSNAIDEPGGGGGSTLVPYLVGARRTHLDEDLDLLLRNDQGNPSRDVPFFTWQEHGKRDAYAATRARCVRIVDSSDTTVDDDRSGRIAVVLTATPIGHNAEWVAFWAGPLSAAKWPPKVRFMIEGADGRTHCSDLFDPAVDRGKRGTGTACPARERPNERIDGCEG